MDRRRNGLIALVVLVTAVVALVYYEMRPPAPEPTTAFAPAQSADESVAPSDTPIVPPGDLAAATDDEAEAPGADTAAVADDEPEAPGADTAAVADDEPEAPGADTTAVADDLPEAPAADTAAVVDEEAEAPVADTAAVVDDEAEAPVADTTAVAEDEAEALGADTAATTAVEAEPLAVDTAAVAEDEPEAPVAEAPAEPSAGPEVETDIAMIDPADVPAASEPGTDAPVAVAEPDEPPMAVPTFDIVRVEVTGETVIAGQGEPNATIEIMDGPTVIATAEANEAGEWVIALDDPLAPGSHDLAISTTTPDGAFVTLSDERVTVSVPEDGSGDVLVVLNLPDAPSAVLQIPPAATPEPEVAVAEEPAAEEQDVAAVAPSAETDVAVVEPPAEQELAAVDPQDPAPVVEDDVASNGDAVAEAPAVDVVEPGAMAETATAPDATDVATAPGPEDSQPGDLAAADAVPDDAVPDESTIDTATAEPADVADEQQVAMMPPEAAAEAPVPVEESAAAESLEEVESEVAITAPVAEEPPAPPPPPQPMVTVAAVEADTNGALYVAGVAATGETVRVYVDDEYIDDARPSPSGTWLVETVMDLPAGQYVIRVDQVAADGSVIARYEVPFDREVEVAILKPTGETASAEGATLAGAMPEVDTVIIKRGDNLWRIARATWGKGIRWSTIYQANGDQIRNPHRIYPGQVFVMPKGDTAWQN